MADWRSADLLRPSLGEDDTTLTLLMAQTSFIAPNSRFAFLRGAVSRSIWTIGWSGQNRGRKESVDLHPRLAWEQNMGAFRFLNVLQRFCSLTIRNEFNTDHPVVQYEAAGDPSRIVVRPSGAGEPKRLRELS